MTEVSVGRVAVVSARVPPKVPTTCVAAARSSRCLASVSALAQNQLQPPVVT